VPPVPVLGTRLDVRSEAYRANRDAMAALLDEVSGLMEQAITAGGQRYIDRHRERGKMLVRERIELLLDRDTPFLELHALAGYALGEPPGAGQVQGIGLIHNVECFINGVDMTVKGGASNPSTVEKSLRGFEIAKRNRLPYISLTESAGADLPRQSDIFVPGGASFKHLTQLSAAGVPTISLVFGPSTAGGAYTPGMSDYVVMVKERAQVFLGGPPLVKMAIDEDADEETLGGADMHSRISGLSDYLAVDELDAIRIGREIVSHLNWRKQGPGATKPADPPVHDPDELLGAASADVRIPFDTREILARVLDGSRFEVWHTAGHRLGFDLRVPGRCARQQRHPVLRGVAEGRAVHPAVQPHRCADRLRAEHHRLHGRHPLRAGRHHQRRCEADQRGVELDGAASHADGRRVLRRGQLRHERQGVRPAVHLHVAQPSHCGDGPQAVGRCDEHRDEGARPRGDRRAGKAGRTGVHCDLRDESDLGRRHHRPTRHAHGARHRVVGGSQRSGAGHHVVRRLQDVMGAMSMISTLLVANRGEIARRIFRTAREMGIRTVAVYSEPDARSPHVREADIAVALGGSTAAESYLDVAKLIDAARRSGADAIHPGYGFLSENAAFAEAVVGSGLAWVGPPASAIRAMGGKIEAKRLASAAGVPTLPSAEIIGDDTSAWSLAADGVGYPLLVKASAGGGGKGMRIVRSADELIDAVTGARREAASSFGDGTVFVERYLGSPRHIEIQVFADQHGTLVHLFERECSIQRRHQKIVEEAPSPALSASQRDAMGAAAVGLARSIGYVGAGTVEFLTDDAMPDEFFFLEMNTRLQVEHPVTECITGFDLVRWQIEVARGRHIPVQDQITMNGHAIEVRLYAEDPANGFMPAFGTLERYAHDGDLAVRWDEGVESGSVVSTFYDPMLAKVITHAWSRDEAAARLRGALQRAEIHGVTTNRDQLVGILGEDDFLAGRTSTAYVDAHPSLLAAPVAPMAHPIAAVLVGSIQRRRCDRQWSFAPNGWRNLVSQPHRMSYLHNGSTVDVGYRWTGERAATVSVGDVTSEIRVVASEPVDAHIDAVTLDVDGLTTRAVVRIVEDRTWVNSAAGQSQWLEVPRFTVPGVAATGSGPMAPVPGRVVAVRVAVGDHVEAGQPLVVMEAMKMEHQIEAAEAGVVVELRCAVGDQVDARQVLVVLS
jgi:propionyl-CoA carboxylase alpha chain